MNIIQFDDFLRQALVRAEEKELRELNLLSKEIDVSKEFEQKILALIRKHSEKKRNQNRTIALKILSRAAIILLVVILSITALYMVSPQARAYVDTIIKRVYKDHNTYRFSTKETTVEEGDYSLGYIPEGFELVDEIHRNDYHLLTYTTKNNDLLHFFYRSASIGTLGIDNEHMKHQEIEINDMNGMIAYSNEEPFSVAFVLDDDVLLKIVGDFTYDEAIYLLESIQSHK